MPSNIALEWFGGHRQEKCDEQADASGGFRRGLGDRLLMRLRLLNQAATISESPGGRLQALARTIRGAVAQFLTRLSREPAGKEAPPVSHP